MSVWLIEERTKKSGWAPIEGGEVHLLKRDAEYDRTGRQMWANECSPETTYRVQKYGSIPTARPARIRLEE